MAKQLTPNGGKSPEGTINAKHNVANLTELIRGCATEMNQIKEERQELNARAGDIRKKLKDAGVQSKAFEFALRVQAMEPEGRDSYMESLKLNFEALGIGAQGDLFAPEPAKDNTEQPAP